MLCCHIVLPVIYVFYDEQLNLLQSVLANLIGSVYFIIDKTVLLSPYQLKGCITNAKKKQQYDDTCNDRADDSAYSCRYHVL